MGLGMILLSERIHTLTVTLPLPGGASAVVSIAWLILFSLWIVVIVGSETVQRDESELEAPWRPRRIRLHPAAWILPILVTTAAFLFLRWVGDRVVRAIGLGIAGLVLVGVSVAQHYTYDEREQVRRLSEQVLETLVYPTAFFLYSAIYALKVRSLFSATSIVLLSYLMAYTMLRKIGPQARARTAAAIISLCVGEVTWPLNYWAIGGLFGGTFLLLVFYLLLNLVRQGLLGRLTWRVALEYLLVGLLGMAAITAALFGVP
ncbi:MAG: hypothetical protein ACP5SI_09275, partial [Chloroflexia bacterium]